MKADLSTTFSSCLDCCNGIWDVRSSTTELVLNKTEAACCLYMISWPNTWTVDSLADTEEGTTAGSGDSNLILLSLVWSLVMLSGSPHLLLPVLLLPGTSIISILSLSSLSDKLSTVACSSLNGLIFKYFILITFGLSRVIRNCVEQLFYK